MVKIGDVIAMSSDPDEKYLIAKRIDDFGHGEKGWMCINTDAILEKGTDNISAFDCWRFTDHYLEIQMERGAIVLTKP